MPVSILRSASRLLMLAFALGSTVGIASCSRLFAKPFDPASGNWKGHWFVGNATKPAGGLDCVIQKPVKGEWKAEFDAEFGQRARYQVDLVGHREGDKVVFGGQVDLGAASGGVFDWSGEIAGNEFNGKYTSKAISGTFKLTKSDAAAAPAK